MTVDWRAVFAGARRAVLAAGATIVAAQVVATLADSDITLVLYPVVLVGLGAGGWVAARRQPLLPLTHGSLAAIAAYLVLVAVITAVRLAVGREVTDPVLIVSNGFMAASAGIVGGYLAMRRGRRSA